MILKVYRVFYLESELVLIFGDIHHASVCNAAGQGHPRLRSGGTATQLLTGLDYNLVSNG